MDLALNNLQRLICHKINQPTKQCEIRTLYSAMIFIKERCVVAEYRFTLPSES